MFVKDIPEEDPMNASAQLVRSGLQQSIDAKTALMADAQRVDLILEMAGAVVNKIKLIEREAVQEGVIALESESGMLGSK